MSLRWKLAGALIAAVVLANLFLSALLSLSSAQAAGSWSSGVKISIPGANSLLDASVVKDTSGAYHMWYTYLQTGQDLTATLGILKTLPLSNLIADLSSFNLSGALTDLGTLSQNSAAMTTIESLANTTRTVIGYATSADGVNWTVQNPVALQMGSGLWNSVVKPTVIWDSTASRYKMWFTRVNTTLNWTSLQTFLTNAGSTNQAARQQAAVNLIESTYTSIGYAESSDGSAWTIVNPRVFPPASQSSILQSVGAPSVVKDGSTYKMWYTAVSPSLTDADLGTILAGPSVQISDVINILGRTGLVIGYATSGDGTSWAVQNGNVFPGGSTAVPFWHSAADASVIKTGAGWEMWYTNITTNLHAADLSNLVTQMQNLNIPGLWNEIQTQGFLATLSTLFTDTARLSVISTIKGILSGAIGSGTGTGLVIGHAVSADGISWQVSNSQDVTGASISPWSSTASPSVVQSAAGNEMWYLGGIPDLTAADLMGVVLGSHIQVFYVPGLLTSISLTAPTASILIGGSVQVTATAHYTNGSQQDITGVSGVTWASSSPGTASVSATGLVTGAAVGTTTITATYGGVTSASYQITVTSPSAYVGGGGGGAIVTSPTPTATAAQFTFSNLRLSPATVNVGDIVTVSVDVTNTGGQSGTQTVTLTVNGKAVTSQDATLAGGAKTTLTFTISETQAGTYVVSVGGLSATLIVQAVVTPPPTTPPPTTPTPKPAAFTLSHLVVAPLVVKPNEQVVIAITVANTGETQGTYTVVLKIDGAVAGTQDVSLAAGTQQKVTFTVSRAELRAYQVAVGDLTASFTVSPPPSRINWWLIGGIIAVIVAAAAVVVLLTVRRRTQ